MKRLFLLTLPVLSAVGCASMPTSTTEPMTTYQRIVDVPNVKQDMVYEGARQWVAKSFKSANSVIQYQDKSTGSIIGKGNIDYPCQGIECLASAKSTIEFTLKVDSKDNKARVSFNDLNLHTPSYYNGVMMAPETNYKIYSDAQKTRVKALLDAVVDNLASDIAKTGTTDKNW